MNAHQTAVENASATADQAISFAMRSDFSVDTSNAIGNDQSIAGITGIATDDSIAFKAKLSEILMSAKGANFKLGVLAVNLVEQRARDDGFMDSYNLFTQSDEEFALEMSDVSFTPTVTVAVTVTGLALA